MTPPTRPPDPARAPFRCRCICQGERCADEATQEDGLCDWCGERTYEQLQAHPNAMFGPENSERPGHFYGIGGAGLSHASYSCWDTRTERTLADA